MARNRYDLNGVLAMCKVLASSTRLLTHSWLLLITEESEEKSLHEGERALETVLAINTPRHARFR